MGGKSRIKHSWDAARSRRHTRDCARLVQKFSHEQGGPREGNSKSAMESKHDQRSKLLAGIKSKPHQNQTKSSGQALQREITVTTKHPQANTKLEKEGGKMQEKGQRALCENEVPLEPYPCINPLNQNRLTYECSLPYIFTFNFAAGC